VLRDLRLGLSLSLSGRYAAMGKQAEAGIRQFIADTNTGDGVTIDGSSYQLALECYDDQSRADRAIEIYQDLCRDHRCDLIFGPYSSDLTRAVVPITERAGMVLLNHGGADDSLHNQGYRMIVSILSPASDYLVGFIDLLATLKFWRKRLAIAHLPTPFAETIVGGVERAIAARRIWLRGVRLRAKYRGRFDPENTPAEISRLFRRYRINAFGSAGSYDYDVAMMRLATASHHNIPVLSCIAAGATRFGEDLGDDAEGIVGPSQWEPELEIHPELGPSPINFTHRIGSAASDYPAAQIYAAGLTAIEALRVAGSLDQGKLREALGDLRATTLFGDFAIDRVTGRQIGHKLLLVQWHEGHKAIIPRQGDPGSGELTFPSRRSWMILPRRD